MYKTVTFIVKKITGYTINGQPKDTVRTPVNRGELVIDKIAKIDLPKVNTKVEHTLLIIENNHKHEVSFIGTVKAVI